MQKINLKNINYKLSKDSGKDIKKMYDEFINESYEDIKDTLCGLDELDVF